MLYEREDRPSNLIAFEDDIPSNLLAFKDDLTAKKYYECHITLKNIPSDNVNKLIFAHLNINYTRNKFGFLVTQVKGKIDI